MTRHISPASVFLPVIQPVTQTVDSTSSPDQTRLDGWSLEHAQDSAQELLAWAGQEFGDKLALTCSFGGPTGMVLVDLVAKHAPKTPVFVIDTQVLFDQTYKTIDAVEKHYNLKVRFAVPEFTLDAQAQEFGPELWKSNPNQCCDIRKVQPLRRTLKNYRAWITGVRRDQASTRADTQLVSWGKNNNVIKLCPLAAWTEEQVWAYIYANDVPFNPMLKEGYTSIGCTHCTQKPSSDDPRSGRWAGTGKTECGLH